MSISLLSARPAPDQIETAKGNLKFVCIPCSDLKLREERPTPAEMVEHILDVHRNKATTERQAWTLMRPDSIDTG